MIARSLDRAAQDGTGVGAVIRNPLPHDRLGGTRPLDPFLIGPERRRREPGGIRRNTCQGTLLRFDGPFAPGRPVRPATGTPSYARSRTTCSTPVIGPAVATGAPIPVD